MGDTTSEKLEENKVKKEVNSDKVKAKNIKRRLLARIVCTRIVSEIVTRAVCPSTRITALSRLTNCFTSNELTRKVIETAKRPDGRGLKRKRKSKNKLGEMLVVNCENENYPPNIRS